MYIVRFLLALIINMICERCGKEFFEDWRKDKQQRRLPARFCSRACANARNHSQESRNIVSKKLKKIPDKFCIICGKKLSKRAKQFCFDCYSHSEQGRLLKSEKNKVSCKGVCGGYRKGSGDCKKGWYKGIHCDSSWELAYVIYNLDHNIPFKRNKESFEYEFNGAIHKYYPDFIEGDTFIEIKGRQYDSWKAKQDAFPGKLKTLYSKEMKVYLDYVKSVYGKDFTSLYENNMDPSASG